MKKLLLLLPFLLIGSIRSHSAEVIEPVEFCYSSTECSLFLFHNNTGEFVVDDPAVFEAVKGINTKDFNFSIQRTTAAEKARQTAIARDTKRTLYITNKELIALQRQGLKSVNTANRCAWNLAGCATAAALIRVGKDSSKVVLARLGRINNYL